MGRKNSKEYSVVFLVEGEKFKLRNIPSRIPRWFSSRVELVFKGFKVHDFEHYGQRNYVLKWKVNLCH